MSKDFFYSIEKENILNDFENYLRAEGQRLNTIRGNTGSVNLFLDWTAKEQINYLQASYTDILAFIDHNKDKGNTKHTINQKLQGIRHFYNHLQQQGKVPYNPCEELRIKGVIRRQPHDLLEWEELKAMYNSFPTNNVTGKRNKVILGLIIYQGLHTGEITALETGDVKLEEGKIYIPGVGRSNSRTLKLESVQILQLQKYITQVRPVLLAIYGKTTEKLFVSSGNSYYVRNVYDKMRRLLRQQHPNFKNLKQIRASVITYWLKHHGIRQVQYMTGHRYVSSTERYRTDLLESLQEQIDELHPLK